MSPARTMQRRARRSFLRLWLAGTLGLALLFGAARSEAAPTASEAEVKAAFLYHLAKFVEWPATAFSSETAPLRVAVFGDEEFAAKLSKSLSEKTAHGRTFEVKRIVNPQEAKNFHMVFIPNSESKRAILVLDAVKNAPVLTVGESDEFFEYGGMINLYFEDSQLRFEINAQAAEKVKLVISSKLLRLNKKKEAK
jgi:hypothetical protein